jgi:uncharacterized cupredoxin-like copper-binding protein
MNVAEKNTLILQLLVESLLDILIENNVISKSEFDKILESKVKIIEDSIDETTSKEVNPNKVNTLLYWNPIIGEA